MTFHLETLEGVLWMFPVLVLAAAALLWRLLRSLF